MPKKKIMIVDDDESLIEALTAVLEREGYEIIPAISGEECLEKLNTIKPDIILLDMMMPGLSGRRVCKRIRENPKTKNLKVAFLTVVKFSETGKGTLKDLNVVDYITKPFDNEDLVKRVKKLVG
ncbi:MAG: response regulator [Candidatus Aenigmarchaeota archaeon]